MTKSLLASPKSLKRQARFVYLTVFLSGAIVLILEILGTRVLAPFYGATVFVWSSLISVTLGFLALGYYYGGKWADRKPSLESLYRYLFIAGIAIILIPVIDSWILIATDFMGIRFGPLVSSLILFSTPLFFLGTVSPYIIKAKADTMKHLAATSGNIFALATVGSLIGALSVGYVFIPYFSMKSVITGSGLVLIALWFIWLVAYSDTKKSLVMGIVVFMAAVLTPHHTVALQDNIQILHKETGFFGELKIYQAFKDITCLMINTSSQSCWNFGEDASAWAYTRYVRGFENFYNESSYPLDILILGLGGGSIVKEWAPSGHAIDVVEINPRVIQLAQEYIGLPGADQGVNYILGDARHYVRHTDKLYDIIMVDTIIGDDIAFHLSTVEFYKEIRRILDPYGLFAVNAKGRLKTQKLQPIVYKTLNQVFPEVKVTARDPENLSTVVFFAANGPLDIKQFKGTIKNLFGSEVWDGQFNLTTLPIVTDDYNPTHLLDLETKPEGRHATQETFGNGIYLYDLDV